jgi:hypothetical protein
MTPGMNAKDLIFFSRSILILVIVLVVFTRACTTWTRTGKGRRAGRLAAFANKKYTSNRCLLPLFVVDRVHGGVRSRAALGIRPC